MRGRPKGWNGSSKDVYILLWVFWTTELEDIVLMEALGLGERGLADFYEIAGSGIGET